MKLNQVIGTVVLSRCIEPFKGKTLHVTQNLNERLELVGDADVSMGWEPVREGELAIVEIARESANAFDPPVPTDSVIIGRVDRVHIDERYSGGV